MKISPRDLIKATINVLNQAAVADPTATMAAVARAMV